MPEEKARLPDVPRSTHDNLNLFKAEYNKSHQKDRLKTIGATIDKLLLMARQCDQAMGDYVQVRDAFAAYRENYQPKIDYYEARIEELEERIRELEKMIQEDREMRG